jgi:hypothetical protein
LEEDLEVITNELKLDHVYVESLWWVFFADEDDDDLVGPDLLLGAGLDANHGFEPEMKAFLTTGEGLLPKCDYDIDGERVVKDYTPDPESSHAYDMSISGSDDGWDDE